MNYEYYKVKCESIVIAERMDLETALILVKALFHAYYREPCLEYTIEKMQEEKQE